jgi:hypothetical protein
MSRHAASAILTVHEHAGAPSISTRQAPHCSLPQPYFTLEQPISSCKAHSNAADGCVATS